MIYDLAVALNYNLLGQNLQKLPSVKVYAPFAYQNRYATAKLYQRLQPDLILWAIGSLYLLAVRRARVTIDHTIAGQRFGQRAEALVTALP